MARSGADDFYEVVKLIFVKHLTEQAGSGSGLISLQQANALLLEHATVIARFVEGDPQLHLPDEVCEECFRLLSDISIHDSEYEVLDSAFEMLTSRNYKSDKGQYFTPRHVVEMCVRALRPQRGALICDPACGSGAFLKKSYDALMQDGGPAPPGKTLFGFDYSRRAARTASFLSYLSAQDDIVIGHLDSLNCGMDDLLKPDEPSIESFMSGCIPDFSGFDYILTNPPFAGDVSGHRFLARYETARLFNQKVERDVLFVERCLRLLKPGGRLAIVVPDNKISSKKYSPARSWLIENARIDAVVSLHGHTFRPHTSQKAAVIFCTKTRESDDYPIAFYRSDLPGKTSNGESVLAADGKSVLHDLADIADDIAAGIAA